MARPVGFTLPAGSYLAVRDGVDTNEAYTQAIERYNASGAVPYNLRSVDQLTGYLDGLELVEPGVVSCPLWRPEHSRHREPDRDGRPRRRRPQAVAPVRS